MFTTGPVGLSRASVRDTDFVEAEAEVEKKLSVHEDENDRFYLIVYSKLYKCNRYDRPDC